MYSPIPFIANFETTTGYFPPSLLARTSATCGSQPLAARRPPAADSSLRIISRRLASKRCWDAHSRPTTAPRPEAIDRKSTRLNSSHGYISYAVFCLKKKKKTKTQIIFTVLFMLNDNAGAIRYVTILMYTLSKAPIVRIDGMTWDVLHRLVYIMSVVR